MGKISLTQSKGKGSIRHNNRDFVSPNVHVDRIKDNIPLKKQSLDNAYEEHFGNALNDYNAKQKRKSRRIECSYFEHLFNVSPSSIDAQSVLQNKDKCKSFYEDIIQIGDMVDCGVFF